MIENFDFYDKTVLKSYNLEATMRYQLNLLDTLDVYTRKHCENVANLTCRICEYLNYSQEFTIYCTICAYLHDIGKMFIPAKILQKNGPLTDEEYEIMKKHTTLGYNMCMNDKSLQLYARGPKFHHEALDGSGYPEGLKAKDIPLEGQVIRVADVFDALVSKRQYKSHIDISDTLQIIIKDTNPTATCSTLEDIVHDAKVGKVNPKIVKALLKVIIDDTEYEISCADDYIKYLKEEIKRLEEIDMYYKKMNDTKNENKKAYFMEGIKYLLRQGETVENYPTVLKEYKEAVVVRKERIDKLYVEIKKIKKLKV